MSMDILAFEEKNTSPFYLFSSKYMLQILQ